MTDLDAAPTVDARTGHAGSRVDLDEVTKRYTVGEVEVTAIAEISLHVDEAAFVVILGPSGRGKTTLLNMIGAPRHPDVRLGPGCGNRSERGVAGDSGSDPAALGQLHYPDLQPLPRPHRVREREVRCRCLSPTTLALAVGVGVVAVALAPRFLVRRLTKMSIPDTLRVME